MKDLLKELNACDEAIEWVGDKTWEEAYNTCERGDWLLWLFQKTNPDDLQRLTLAKGHCANTVRHLMISDRSIKAVDAAIAFGEGKATKEELDIAVASAAYSADYSAFAAYDYAIAAAFAAAASYIAAAYCADNAAYSAAYASDDDADAKKKNQKLTADICRKYLPIEIWNV